MNYTDFINKKRERVYGKGFDPVYMPDFLFDFQKFIVEKSLTHGRFANFADCGLGKTVMQLVWAKNVLQKTNKPVLLISPLSVSMQTVQEAEKFGIEAARDYTGKVKKGIITTNYERISNFDYSKFGGVVCDESSIIKNSDGATRKLLNEFLKKVPYRLLCTATAAPNDYIELGTSSELLGYMGYVDMLSHFFKNDKDSISPAFYGSSWRFKPHAESRFWEWLSTWAIACRKPSDLGFSNKKFILPELKESYHFIKSPRMGGFLKNPPTKTWDDMRKDNKNTIELRCDKAAELLKDSDCAIAWCNLNAESAYLKQVIKGGVEVTGSQSDEEKEEIFNAFLKKEVRVLITKPKISSFGMNWQHCCEMSYFLNYSYEQKYQSVRRCYRFGQNRPVAVHNISTSRQRHVARRVMEKENSCTDMFAQLIKNMNTQYQPDISEIKKDIKVPEWMS